MRLPGDMAGDQEIALTPIAWAGKVSISDDPSSDAMVMVRIYQHHRYSETERAQLRVEMRGNLLLNFNTEIFPSLDAQARIGPSS